jgi:death-on-curing family protein
MQPLFLDLDHVLRIHRSLIEAYGGIEGVRDIGLLHSAIAMPQASFGGEFLHKDFFEMAAAYLYHITQNHAFLDGNKRTGAATAIVFSGNERHRTAGRPRCFSRVDSDGCRRSDWKTADCRVFSQTSAMSTSEKRKSLPSLRAVSSSDHYGGDCSKLPGVFLEKSLVYKRDLNPSYA